MWKLALSLLSVGAALVASAPAQAAITISVQYNGGDIVQVANSNTGSAVFNGTYGAAGLGCAVTDNNCFSITTTAQGYPLLNQPNLQTTSLETRTSDGGADRTLTVFVTQTDLNPIAAAFTSGLTNNNQTGSAQSVTLSTLLGSQLLASQTFTANDSASYTSFASQPATFSETARYTLTFGAGAGSFNNTVSITAAVPEPATWGMMLVGFAMIGVVIRRRKSLHSVRYA